MKILRKLDTFPLSHFRRCKYLLFSENPPTKITLLLRLVARGAPQGWPCRSSVWLFLDSRFFKVIRQKPPDFQNIFSLRITGNFILTICTHTNSHLCRSFRIFRNYLWKQCCQNDQSNAAMEKLRPDFEISAQIGYSLCSRKFLLLISFQLCTLSDRGRQMVRPR